MSKFYWLDIDFRDITSRTIVPKKQIFGFDAWVQKESQYEALRLQHRL
jgi:hypothetical protein